MKYISEASDFEFTSEQFMSPNIQGYGTDLLGTYFQRITSKFELFRAENVQRRLKIFLSIFIADFQFYSHHISRTGISV